VDHCCDEMKRQAESRCELHPDRTDCPDALISYNPRSRLNGISVHDGGSSSVAINHCPWCGADLRATKAGKATGSTKL
jgi:hypothetical protein